MSFIFGLDIFFDLCGFMFLSYQFSNIFGAFVQSRKRNKIAFLLRKCSALSLVEFSRSVMSDSATLWTACSQASLFVTNSRSLLKLMSIELVMPPNQLILCCPLLLLPSIFPSIRIFSSEWVLLIRWPKYWSFSISNSPSNEYWGLISFRID